MSLTTRLLNNSILIIVVNKNVKLDKGDGNLIIKKLAKFQKKYQKFS